MDHRKKLLLASAARLCSLGLELEELQRQIEAQKAKIEELSGGQENQVESILLNVLFMKAKLLLFAQNAVKQ